MGKEFITVDHDDKMYAVTYHVTSTGLIMLYEIFLVGTLGEWLDVEINDEDKDQILSSAVKNYKERELERRARLFRNRK